MLSLQGPDALRDGHRGAPPRWPPLLVAFLELQRQFADDGLEPNILTPQARCEVHLLGHLKRLPRVRQKLITPLVIVGLADLIVLTNCGHQLALEALKDDS